MHLQWTPSTWTRAALAAALLAPSTVLAASEAAPTAQPEAVDAGAPSEQLRLYDQAFPMLTIPASLRRPAQRTRRGDGRPFSALIDEVALAYRIDPPFLQAIVDAESARNPRAVSSRRAIGLLQVTPATAARFGVSSARLTEPGTNLRVGATLLKTLQARFGNDLPLVLAAYNAGEGAVAAHGGRVPDYPETKAYVATVMRTYRSAVATR